MAKLGISAANESMRISGDHLSRLTFLYVLVVLALWPFTVMFKLPRLAIRKNANIVQGILQLNYERLPAVIRLR